MLAGISIRAYYSPRCSGDKSERKNDILFLNMPGGKNYECPAQENYDKSECLPWKALYKRDADMGVSDT